jgi:hypothetical protein
MNAGARVCTNLFKHMQTKHSRIIQSMSMYINGGTNAYYEHVDNDNVYNTGKKRCLLMYCCIALKRPTVAARGPHIIYVLSFLCRNLHDHIEFLKL